MDELREKLIEWREEKYFRADAGIPVEFEDGFEERKLQELDQILSLIDPERIRKEEMVLDWVQAGKDIEEARKEERERIIKLVSELEEERVYEFPELKTAILEGRQALKEEK